MTKSVRQDGNGTSVFARNGGFFSALTPDRFGCQQSRLSLQRIPFWITTATLNLESLFGSGLLKFSRRSARADNPLGNISAIVARQIVAAADQAATLTPDLRDLIREALLGLEEIPEQDCA